MDALTFHTIWPWVFFGLILMILLVVMAFCFTEFALAINYIKAKKRLSDEKENMPPQFDELPHVTIQIPIFNEKYVAERAIRSCADINYPLDRLQIQILDDSTDETVEISRNTEVEPYAFDSSVQFIYRD